ncbi:MAG: SDR family oxidoreductase [Bacteroidetes bacterium]|nr:SDR family oxidoreductase [Bacteroidota bacterium]MCB0746515.1 SDR family oxidoreductase [Ignavibacteriota bacterium]
MNALITGGSRGIGLAIAKELAIEGFNIFIASKNQESIEKAKKELLALNSLIKVEGFATNFEDPTLATKSILDWLNNKTKSIDLFVLNAGIFIDGSISDFSEKNYNLNMDVNFTINFKLIQAILPFVKKSTTKRIVLIGSTAAYEPYPLVPTYGIIKYALKGLAINLRTELMKENIGVTFISPGGTKTDMWEGVDLPENRLLAPSDIGKIVALIPKLSSQAVIDELIIRPMLGDIHE